VVSAGVGGDAGRLSEVTQQPAAGAAVPGDLVVPGLVNLPDDPVEHLLRVPHPHDEDH
jgi:alpha-D-ribose 1-methylphosphonate 5-triphosphate diphosphatase PhnM